MPMTNSPRTARLSRKIAFAAVLAFGALVPPLATQLAPAAVVPVVIAGGESTDDFDPG